MTQEEKQVLIKDLCARLPYGVKVNYYGTPMQMPLQALSDEEMENGIKPYLRPIDSMTEEEANEVAGEIIHSNINSRGFVWVEDCSTYIDWLNAHHFDYRGLIEKGLALEAPEGMYKND